MLSDFDLVGRERSLFADDLEANSALLLDRLKDARVLVIGAAGSVGQAVTLEVLGWRPEITVREMCAEMVAEDYKSALRHSLLEAHGMALPSSREP